MGELEAFYARRRRVTFVIYVTDMYAMFSHAGFFNQPLNNWNVSNVEDMRYVFDFPSSFDQRRHAPWYVPTEEEEEE